MGDDDTFLKVPDDLTGRTRPALTPETTAFWEGLARGQLILPRCRDCLRLNWISNAGCPWCGSEYAQDEEVEAVGTVYTYTVAYRDFGVGMQAPYAPARVALSAEPELRLVTNIVNCRISDASIGMPVKGVFANAGTHGLLFFEPY